MKIFNLADVIMYKYPNAIPGDNFLLEYDPITENNKMIIWKLPYPQITENEASKISEELMLKKEKQDKISELDRICNSAILGRFKAILNEVEYEFSYDLEAQSRFNGVGILFLGNKITELPWTAYINGNRVRIVLTKEDFDIVSIAALNHQNNNITKYNQLLQIIDETHDIDEVRDISW